MNINRIDQTQISNVGMPRKTIPEKASDLNIKDSFVECSGNKDDWTVMNGVRGALNGMVEGVKTGLIIDIASIGLIPIIGAAIMSEGMQAGPVGIALGALALPIMLGVGGAAKGFSNGYNH